MQFDFLRSWIGKNSESTAEFCELPAYRLEQTYLSDRRDACPKKCRLAPDYGFIEGWSRIDLHCGGPFLV